MRTALWWLVWLAAGMCLCIGAAPVATSDTSDRVISVDFNRVQGPKSTVYRRCVGAGRLAEGLRADWQDQLRTCRQSIGFEYLRCHGLLQDELGVYSEDAKGNPVYNFQYIDMVYDFLQSIGVRPFVEIGFMPQALASVKSEFPSTAPSTQHLSQPVFWWKANVTAPKSWDKWDGLITALVRHWTERYGTDEVRQWYFEVWNEPDYPYFFSPANEATRRDEYFTLYAHTARAVKAVDKDYRVGGPAGAFPVWVADLIAYSAKNNVPLDFVSYHCYGLGNTDGAAVDVDGHQRLFLSRNLDQISDRAHKQDAIIQKSAMPSLPVHVTEWSASYSNHDPIHDSYFEAPYVLEQLKKTRALGSMSYWTFSDIFEESGPPKTPFEGGFGLINLQGIKKPAFFAYQFLNQLGDQELKNTDARSWVCRDQTGGLQALIYDLTDPRPDMTATDWDFFHKRIIPAVKPPIHLQIASLPPGKYRLAIHRTGFEENDAFSEYLKMGTPSQLTRPQVQHLKDLASGSPAEQSEVTVDGGGKWQRDFAMRDNEVVFATLTPETDASMHR